MSNWSSSRRGVLVVAGGSALVTALALAVFTERGRRAVSVLIWGDPVAEEAQYLRDVLVRAGCVARRVLVCLRACVRACVRA